MTKENKPDNSKRVDVGVRAFPSDLAIINEAAQIEATKRGVPFSRGAFCVEVLLKASRKIIAEQK